MTYAPDITKQSRWQEMADEERSRQELARTIRADAQIEYERAHLQAWFAERGENVVPAFADFCGGTIAVFLVEGLLMSFSLENKAPYQHQLAETARGQFRIIGTLTSAAKTLADIGAWPRLPVAPEDLPTVEELDSQGAAYV